MCVMYSRPHELPGVQVTQKIISVLEITTIPWEVTLFLQLPAVPGNLTISGYRVICWRSQTGECAIKQNFWAAARKLDVFSWCAKKKEDNKEELWLWIWKNYSDPILKKAAKQLKYKMAREGINLLECLKDEWNLWMHDGWAFKYMPEDLQHT